MHAIDPIRIVFYITIYYFFHSIYYITMFFINLTNHLTTITIIN